MIQRYHYFRVLQLSPVLIKKLLIRNETNQLICIQFTDKCKLQNCIYIETNKKSQIRDKRPKETKISKKGSKI